MLGGGKLIERKRTLDDKERLVGLAAQTFDLSGRQGGTGGEHHVVLGGAFPTESPFFAALIC